MSNFFVKLIKNPFVINLLLVIVVSCGVVYGVLAWLDSYTRHNQAVVVPDVKGMKLEDAAEFFGNNKLRYNVIDSDSRKMWLRAPSWSWFPVSDRR